MSKRKLDAKAFAQQKRKRRQLLTFARMCRYGVNNFSRNAWLTIAATAVMTITLLVVFTTFAARNVLLDTVGVIRDSVDMSIYVLNGTDDQEVASIKSGLEKLKSVKEVSYISPDQARDNFAQANNDDSGALNALNQATNRFPGTFRVKIVDINDPSELRTFVETNEVVKENIDPNRKPSFAGDRKSAIENIGRWVGFAEKAGLLSSVIFVAISSLIVFNTIRMAIFNRKDEIQMMKLIGADKSFIRGPFLVEAVVYGCIAAVIATMLGVVLLQASSAKLLAAGVNIQNTLSFATTYMPLVLLGMVFLGGLIGVLSSLLATQRYLKI
jgi:cell division transport system permease protein